jgi:hypothetical protein
VRADELGKIFNTFRYYYLYNIEPSQKYHPNYHSRLRSAAVLPAVLERMWLSTLAAAAMKG